MNSSSVARWPALVIICCLVTVLAATLGAPVPVAHLWSSDAAQAETARRIFLDIRLPRLLAALLVGASLAASGAALQSLFRNPLAEPYLLGLSAGGALGATVAAWRQWPALDVPVLGAMDSGWALAGAGSLAAAWAVYHLGQGRRGLGFDRAGLLLTGVALSAFLSALMALVVALSNRLDLAQQVTFWLLGGLTRATLAQDALLALALAAGLAMLLSSARDMNALRVGDEEAAALGVAIDTLHRRLMLAAALMSAAAVATAGLIGFVGLLAPHLVRRIFGSDARTLLPAAVLGGATLLAGCDALARTAAAPVELPVGIITALLGVPLFLWLARKGK